MNENSTVVTPNLKNVNFVNIGSSKCRYTWWFWDKFMFNFDCFMYLYQFKDKL